MKTAGKAILLLAAVVYFLFPRDLFPDFFGPIGLVDDILLLLFLLWRFGWLSAPVPRAAQKQNGAGRVNNAHTEESKQHEFDPYAVLGIEPEASPDDIKNAYRRLLIEYHPDKVAHLGKEIQEVARNKTTELNRAYKALARSEHHR